MSLEFHEYSRIFKRPIPASYFKVFQALGITWIFKNIQAHKSWKFLEIPSSIFLQVGTIQKFVSMYLPYFIQIIVTSNLNIFTILSALQTLEYDLFLKIILRNNIFP